MLQRTQTGRRQCQVVPRRLIDDGEGVARNSSPTRSPSTAVTAPQKTCQLPRRKTLNPYLTA